MLLKLLRETKNEILGQDFYLWEGDAQRATCRGCNAAFGTFLRRHHCRLCGGIYCESCTATNVKIGDQEHERVCAGCLRGESPGERVKGVMEQRMKTFNKPPADHIFTLRRVNLDYGSFFERTKGSSSASVSAKSTSSSTAAAAASTSSAPSTPKSSGSAPSTPHTSASAGALEAPRSGYFEILNKTSNVCCIKLMSHGQHEDYDSHWEIPRPSYIPLPPMEILSGHFEDAEYLELFVLYANPHPLPEGGQGFHFHTTGLKKLHPAAAPENFASFAVYRIERVAGSNVFLKYKGDGLVETRAGMSIERNGIMGYLMGSKKVEPGKLDFDTNVPPEALQRYL